MKSLRSVQMKKRITNIEQGIPNVEVMYSVYLKKD